MVAVTGLRGCGRSAMSPLQSSTIRQARRSVALEESLSYMAFARYLRLRSSPTFSLSASTQRHIRLVRIGGRFCFQ